MLGMNINIYKIQNLCSCFICHWLCPLLDEEKKRRKKQIKKTNNPSTTTDVFYFKIKVAVGDGMI